MVLTEEQDAIVDCAKSAEEDCILLVDAVAGAGKTSLLVELVKSIPHKSGMYLAYNKSIAVEAAGKFPSTIACSTVHSLAYRATVRSLGLKVGTFNYRAIKESIPYENKNDIVEIVKEFCLSSCVDIEEFSKREGLSPQQRKLATKYLNLMYSGDIECTHDFYMKAFHMHLADGSLKYPKQDFILVDEAGDLNEVTLEVFKLLPARVKLAVGDSLQNIYSFNHTINAFEELKDVGIPFRLTESFRVSAEIASRIESFCTRNIDPEMRFKGQKLSDKTIQSRAMLARTNAGLISAMLSLSASGTEFSLVRKASDIFRLPLLLCFLKYQGKITDPAYKHLQQDFDYWYENPDIQKQFKSPISYIQSEHKPDIALTTACRLVLSRGKADIFSVYDFAKKCEGKRTNLHLATSHSVKGLEYDEVVILEDLNEAVSKALMGATPDFSEEDVQQELNLYYVACSRAKKSLLNAKML